MFTLCSLSLYTLSSERKCSRLCVGHYSVLPVLQEVGYGHIWTIPLPTWYWSTVIFENTTQPLQAHKNKSSWYAWTSRDFCTLSRLTANQKLLDKTFYRVPAHVSHTLAPCPPKETLTCCSSVLHAFLFILSRCHTLSLFPHFPIEASIVRAVPMEAMSACLFGPSVFEARLLQLLLTVLLWLGELESGQMFVFLILLSGVDLRVWEAALIVFPVCSSGAVMILIERKWKIQNKARVCKRAATMSFPCHSDEDQT